MQKSKGCLPVTYVLPDSKNSDDWNQPPLSAGEYLARVRKEASGIPDLMIAPELEKLSAISEPTLLNASSPMFDAHVDWKDRVVSQFSLLSHSLSKLKFRIEEGELPAIEKRPVPPLRAAEHWHYFCFNCESPTSTFTISSRDNLDCKTDDNDDNDTLEEVEIGEDEECEDMEGICLKTTKKRTRDDKLISPTPSISDQVNGDPSPDNTKTQPEEWGHSCLDIIKPTVSLMAQLDGIATHRILTHHIDWLEAISNHQYLTLRSSHTNDMIEMSEAKQDCETNKLAFNFLIVDRCQWVYSILANLTKPLHRDTECEITRLYQTVLRIYQHLTKEGVDNALNSSVRAQEEEVKALCVILTVAGRYFCQAPVEMR